ncbi:head-tail connector protein [Sinorhizobium fredii]|uniref:head-tail connector protein n=1 Tax=Rhizobium fredii TaxID=380 RepID=UPI0019308C6B|nr:head-tail connector protein [Sinorhizobium fredii]
MPAAVKPVSLEEARAHLRVDVDDEDTLITALIDAAISYLDGWSGVLGRCLVNQVWKQSLSDWPACRFIRLPFPDVSAATVKYFDAANAEQTVSASLFERLEDERGTIIWFGDEFTYPTVFDDRRDGVLVEFTAGYGASATDVPAALRHAMLLIIGHWYENRESVVIGNAPAALPMAFDALIAPFRRVGI